MVHLSHYLYHGQLKICYSIQKVSTAKIRFLLTKSRVLSEFYFVLIEKASLKRGQSFALQFQRTFQDGKPGLRPLKAASSCWDTCTFIPCKLINLHMYPCKIRILCHGHRKYLTYAPFSLQENKASCSSLAILLPAQASVLTLTWGTDRKKRGTRPKNCGNFNSRSRMSDRSSLSSSLGTGSCSCPKIISPRRRLDGP